MISSTVHKMSQALVKEAQKTGKEYDPEKLRKALPVVRNVQALQEKSAKLIHELLISLEMRLLCDGHPKTLRVIKGRHEGVKGIYVEIISKDDVLTRIPIADCPHELRAHLLNRESSKNDWELRYAYNEFRRQGWLKPKPPRGERRWQLIP